MMEFEDLLKVTSTLGQCYAWPAWHATLKDRLQKPTIDIPLEIDVQDAASLITTLVSLRKMDDFLRGDRSHADDLIGEEFDLPNTQFLSSKFRQQINKSVAHITNASIQGHDLWPVFEAVHPVLAEVLDRLAESYTGNVECQVELGLTRELIDRQFFQMQNSIGQ